MGAACFGACGELNLGWLRRENSAICGIKAVLKNPFKSRELVFTPPQTSEIIYNDCPSVQHLSSALLPRKPQPICEAWGAVAGG